MQTQSFLTDLIQFKDEIFKTIRLLENRLTADISDKFTQSNLICESINNRLNVISSNNDSLLEILTSQRLNLDKIGIIEKANNKIEHDLITNEIKMKQILTDLENLKEKYDKLVYENLQVTGYIGPGCQYKSISDYIRENISEFSKMKMDKEKIKLENTIIKNKLDNISKSTLNLIDNGIIRCQKYSDRKHADMKTILENKLGEVNEKNMDLRTLVNKAELDNEKTVENLKKEVEKIQNIKEEFINMTENKINEINDKIESMTQEIKLLKSIKREHNNHINNNKGNRKSVVNLNMNMFNKFHNNKNEEENVQSNNNTSKKKIFNKEKIGLNSNINKRNEIIEENNNSKYIEELSKSIKNEEINKENKEKIISEENTLISFEKLIPIINEEKNEEKDEKKIKIKESNLLNEIVIERKLDEIKKENKKDFVINIKHNIIKNEKVHKDNKDDYKKREFSEKKSKNEKHEFFNINDNIENINNIIEKEKPINNTPMINRKTKESKTIIVKKDKSMLPTKIKIESHEKHDKIEKLEKQKFSLSNSSGTIINISNQKKEDIDTDIIKAINYNPIHSNENDNMKNDITNNNIININSQEKEISLIPIINKFQNIDIKNKMRHRNGKIISPTKSLSYYIKSEKSKTKKSYKINEEKKDVMDEIKSHFNFIKEKQEQKSAENLVDCNVINLQLNFNKKKKQKNTSAKYFKNNLSEIGMKLSPAFGRTNYDFFIRNKYSDNYENVKSGLNKMNSLKNGLNAAFVNSIKNKINFN